MQSNRADDQRGLLRKEDLVLPDFLHLHPCAAALSSSTPERSQDCDKIIVQTEIKDERSQQPPSGKTDLMKNSGESSTLKIGLSESKQKLVVVANQNSQKSCKVPFDTSLSPILPFQPSTSWKRPSKELPAKSIQTVEDENMADTTLVSEGDISSPNSTLLPLQLPPTSSDKGPLTEAMLSHPVLLTGNQEESASEKCNQVFPDFDCL